MQISKEQLAQFLDQHAIMMKHSIFGEAQAKRKIVLETGWNSGKHKISPPRVNKLSPLLYKLPPLISRKQVPNILGGIVSDKFLANCDSKNEGPRVRLELFRYVVYPTAYLLEWLEEKHLHGMYIDI